MLLLIAVFNILFGWVMFIPLLPLALALGSVMDWLSFSTWFDVLSRLLLLGIVLLAMTVLVPAQTRAPGPD